MKNKDIKEMYEYKDGVATVTVYNNFTKSYVVGRAVCHPDDMDFESEKTGLSIASSRALIKMLKANIHKLKIERKALNDVLNTFKNRPDYDKDNPYVRILRKQVFALNELIDGLDDEIKDVREFIQNFINLKDAFYKKIKRMR